MEILGHSLDGPPPRLGHHVVTWWPTACALVPGRIPSQRKGWVARAGKVGGLSVQWRDVCRNQSWVEAACRIESVQDSVVQVFGGGELGDFERSFVGEEASCLRA